MRTTTGTVVCLLFLSVSLLAAEGDAPPSPFGTTTAQAGTRACRIVFSNNLTDNDATAGTRSGREITVFDAEAKEHLVIPFDTILVLRQTVLEEGMERQWRWKEGGSDEKVYTGKSYPWRKHGIELVLADGRTVKGRLASGFPITITYTAGRDYVEVETSDGPATECMPMIVEETWLIQPKIKGELGETLDDLVYVRELDLRPKDQRDAVLKEPDDQGQSQGTEPNTEDPSQ